MELMVVLAIISLMVAVSFPNAVAGLEGIRLSSAAGSTAGFLNAALNRAERLQQPVELTVSIRDNAVTMRSLEARFERKLQLPAGVKVLAVWPQAPEEGGEPRRFLFMPGGVPPRIGIEIANRRGTRRIVRVDPITGVPRIERPESP
jgi:hypothetical protein